MRSSERNKFTPSTHRSRVAAKLVDSPRVALQHTNIHTATAYKWFSMQV